MNDILNTYKRAEGTVPSKMLTWHLYGAGMESFGKNRSPEEVPTPGFGPDELLARVDAVGICFSDIKVINLGNEHPRVKGRDLAADPVTLGHEPAITIVGVGENLKSRYHIGQRFIVQADVFYKGKSMAFGYVLAGAQSQYQVITKEVLDGDEGTYLIPLADSTGYAEGAMTEAWACVVAAYRIVGRSELKSGGKLWIAGSADDHTEYTLGMEITSDTVIASGVNAGLLEALESESKRTGFKLVKTLPYSGLDPAVFQDEYGPMDDIILLGQSSETLEISAALLAPNGVLALIGDSPMTGTTSIDVGKIHYQNHGYLGAKGANISQAYVRNRKRSELRKGGSTWFIGGGGPMGKMHVQLAVEMQDGPAKILVTDVGAERLESVGNRFAPTATKNGIEFLTANPMEMSKGDFDKLVHDLTGGAGFDDIIVLAPVGPLIASAAPYLATEGLMNIFAGVPIGTMADLDMSGVYMDQVRFVGSSGSKLSDMQDTLNAAESGELSTCTAVAAIGGMDASWDGMLAVKELKFTGKVVIYPHIRNLGLTGLADLQELLPNVYAKLTSGEFWNNEAEAELLRTTLSGG